MVNSDQQKIMENKTCHFLFAKYDQNIILFMLHSNVMYDHLFIWT